MLKSIASKDFFRKLGRSASTFPIETLLSVTFFVLFTLSVLSFVHWEMSDAAALLFFPLYVLTFTLHRFNWKIPYILSYFLWIPVLLFCKQTGWGIGIAWLLAVILLLIGWEKHEDDTLAGHVVHVVRQIAVAFLIGGVLLLLLEAIMGSIGMLFSLDMGSACYSIPAAFVGFVVIPLLCCNLVSEAPASGDSRFVGILTDKVLAPALVLYTLILYVYAAWILIRWELPVGGVAYLVLSFLVIALAVSLIRTRFGTRNFAWFFDRLPLFCLPPLVLLWIGTLRRLSDYGLTTSRVYLLALVVLMTLFLLMLLRKRTRTFQPMLLILACAAVLVTYIPGISAKDFGIRSQKRRLMQYISDNPALKDPEKALDALRYLKQNLSGEVFSRQYAQYEDSLSDVAGAGITPRKEGEVYELTESIDLEGYSLLVPSVAYHQYEDSIRTCFISSTGNAADTLLRCEVLERLNTSKDPHRLLVYENETYRAVFQYIIDYRGPGDDPAVNFITGPAMLFKKASSTQ